MGRKSFLYAQGSADKSVAPAIALGLYALVAAVFAALLIGPAQVDRSSIVFELFDRLPLLNIDSGLSSIHENIVWEVRTPRVLLGALVGSVFPQGRHFYSSTIVFHFVDDLFEFYA